MNDRSSCEGEDGEYCNLISIGTNTLTGIQVGANAHSGNIYTLGNIWLRSRSQVHGNAYSNGTIDKQDEVVLFGNEKTGDNSAQPFVDSYIAEYLAPVDSKYFKNYNKGPYPYIVNSGESVNISTFGSYTSEEQYKDVTLNSGSSLNLDAPTSVLYNLKVESGATLKMPNNSDENVTIYVLNDFQWKGRLASYYSENSVLNISQKKNIAKHLKIYVLGRNRTHIDSEFYGQLRTLNSDVVVGQSGKEQYGSIGAKSIVLHQDVHFHWVEDKTNSINEVIVMK